MATERRTRGKTWVQTDGRVFTLEVLLLGGPVTREFAKKNKVISRVIQVRGDQTLEELHIAIFDAFDRCEEHMYQFELGGKRPMDRSAKRYVLPLEGDPDDDGDVTSTTLAALNLKVRRVMFYWFDFGDDWWHKITVTAIDEQAGDGAYPRVVSRVGASPPQYPDIDD